MTHTIMPQITNFNRIKKIVTIIINFSNIQLKHVLTKIIFTYKHPILRENKLVSLQDRLKPELIN